LVSNITFRYRVSGHHYNHPSLCPSKWGELWRELSSYKPLPIKVEWGKEKARSQWSFTTAKLLGVVIN